MKKLILPIILMLVGIGGGVGAGLALMPSEEKDDLAEAMVCGDEDMTVEAAAMPEPTPVSLENREYARMNNQFVVPVVTNERVTSLMVLSLSIEVETGGKDAVFSHEPRLRDAFLQVMFDHANMGGFNGAFTAQSNMRLLRNSLQEAADRVMNGHISDVLIVDIVRQDVTN